MSYQDIPPYLDIALTPFLARLTSVVAGTGSQAGMNLYGFVEQIFDPATGLPKDANPGRTDNLQTVGRTYALEVDNQLVSNLTSTPASAPTYAPPIASPLPVPYAWLRLKGIVNGSAVYEFQWQMAQAWVNVTSSTLSTITLTSGTTHGYAATIELYQPTTGTFSTGATAWFVSINGETPTVGKIYQCRPLGADTSGVSIWGETIFATSTTLLTTQTVTLSSPVIPTTNGAFADVVTLSLVAGKYMLFASASAYADTGTTDNQIQGWIRLFDGADLTGNYYVAGLTGTASGTDFTQRSTASIQIPYTTVSSPTIHLQAQATSALGTAALHVQNAVLSSLRLN